MQLENLPTNFNLIKEKKKRKVAHGSLWMKGKAGQNRPRCSRISHNGVGCVVRSNTEDSGTASSCWLDWPCDWSHLYVVYKSELYKHMRYCRSEDITTSVDIFSVFVFISEYFTVDPSQTWLSAALTELSV